MNPITYHQLNILVRQWIESSATNPHNQAYRTGITTAVLFALSSDTRYSPTEFVKAEHRAALELALKIDTTRSDLCAPSKKLIIDLKKLLQESVGYPLIINLNEAARWIEHPSWNHSTFSARPTVIRVLRAIEQAYQLDEAQLPQNTIQLSIGEGIDEYVFYFHGEGYPTSQERRAAIRRLHQQFISLWNQAAANYPPLLIQFIEKIQAGPCIEGATRDALTTLQMQLSTENQRNLILFKDAMAQYVQNAQHLLKLFDLPESPEALHQLISTAYLGQRCLQEANSPVEITINSKTIHDYIQQLQMHHQRFLPDEAKSKEEYSKHFNQIFKLASLQTRSELLSELLNYAAPPAGDVLNTLMLNYRQFVTSTNFMLLINLAQNYKNLLINAAVTDIQDNIFSHFIKKGISIEPLFEIGLPVELLNQPVQLGPWKDTSPLYWLTVTDHAHHFLQQLLKHELIFKAISAEALCCPITYGFHAGASPFFWLTASTEGQAFLQQLLQQEHLVKAISAEALCRPTTHKPRIGESPLFYLTATANGQAILQRLLGQEHILKALSAEALCHPIPQGSYAGASPLFCLTSTADGRTILQQLLQQEHLLKALSAEALCRPTTQGPRAGESPLFCLTSTTDGRTILQQLLQQEHLLKTISAEALCRPITQGPRAGESPFFWLTATDSGRPLLQQLLQQEHILQAISVEALCTPVTQGPRADESPFFWLITNRNGHILLQKLLQQEHLLKALSAAALCRPITRGLLADTSLLYWLTITADSRAILQQLLQQEHLLKALSAESLCRPITHRSRAGQSPLFHLTTSVDGQIILQRLLQRLESSDDISITEEHQNLAIHLCFELLKQKINLNFKAYDEYIQKNLDYIVKNFLNSIQIKDVDALIEQSDFTKPQKAEMHRIFHHQLSIHGINPSSAAQTTQDLPVVLVTEVGGSDGPAYNTRKRKKTDVSEVKPEDSNRSKPSSSP